MIARRRVSLSRKAILGPNADDGSGGLGGNGLNGKLSLGVETRRSDAMKGQAPDWLPSWQRGTTAVARSPRAGALRPAERQVLVWRRLAGLAFMICIWGRRPPSATRL